MNFISSDSCSPFQNDEAAVIEAAVRAAVLSIMKALLDARDMRTKSYQEKLAEVEQENLQLRLKLNAAERQLQSVQQQQHFASAGESCEVSATLTFSPSSSQSLSTLMGGEVSSQNVFEREALDCKLYKEEPADEYTFRIKNEVAEEDPSVGFENNVLAHVGRTGSGQPQQGTVPVQTCGACNSHNQSVEEDAVLTSLERKRLKGNERVRQYRARIRADPEKYIHLKEKDRLRACLLSRYLRRRKTISELSEPMKNLKRKAWREAARRHRARKLAQAALNYPCT